MGHVSVSAHSCNNTTQTYRPCKFRTYRKCMFVAQSMSACSYCIHTQARLRQSPRAVPCCHANMITVSHSATPTHGPSHMALTPINNTCNTRWANFHCAEPKGRLLRQRLTQEAGTPQLSRALTSLIAPGRHQHPTARSSQHSELPRVTLCREATTTTTTCVPVKRQQQTPPRKQSTCARTRSNNSKTEMMQVAQSSTFSHVLDVPKSTPSTAPRLTFCARCRATQAELSCRVLHYISEDLTQFEVNGPGKQLC